MKMDSGTADHTKWIGAFHKKQDFIDAVEACIPQTGEGLLLSEMREPESEGHEGQGEAEEETEFILLDLAGIAEHIPIPPNAPYVLSGLGTENPIMLIDNKIKLIGELEETIGTCLVFNESDSTPSVHVEEGPSEANLFSGIQIIDPQQTTGKEVNLVACVNKVLKFRLYVETDGESGADQEAQKAS